MVYGVRYGATISYPKISYVIENIVKYKVYPPHGGSVLREYNFNFKNQLSSFGKLYLIISDGNAMHDRYFKLK